MNWLKQGSEPLFPDVLWSRPENKRYAGKLLIIGGNSHGFSAVGMAYGAAVQSGIGTARVVLPDALEKVLRKTFPESEFAASTPSGSFGRAALGPLLDSAVWADGVLLAGDFGKNSETSIMLEGFIAKYDGQLAITGDCIDFFLANPSFLTNRKKTLIVGEINQIQKLASADSVIKQTGSLAQIVEQLSEWTVNKPIQVLTVHSNQFVASIGSKVSTTPSKTTLGPAIAAYASVWLLQQPDKPFESLSTAVFECIKSLA